jgi:hypothetical protein
MSTPTTPACDAGPLPAWARVMSILVIVWATVVGLSAIASVAWAMFA